MSSTRRALLPTLVALSLAGVLWRLPVSAATYVPMFDADLARGAPVIVRAVAVSQFSRLERIGGEGRPVTVVTFQRLEVFKGAISETFAVRLAGGKVEGTVWWIPGVPVFEPAREVVLLLGEAPGHPGEYRLTELGLSKFDLVTDEAGRLFAVRAAFGPLEDLEVSKRTDLSASAASIAEDSGPASPLPAREAESFFAALRALRDGAAMPAVSWSRPTGRFDSVPETRHPDWVNIGGREPGDCDGTPCLVRWFWDTGASSNGVVSVSGSQSNLVNNASTPCGTDSHCDVQNAVDRWRTVAQSDVRYSGVSATGNVRVGLDAIASFDGMTWTTPIGCEGGIIGLGGPGSLTGPRTYRGDSSYYATSGGQVSMRKVTCPAGYPASQFRSAVLHEVGHTLGLGHPNQDVSIHSTTSTDEHDHAVMFSTIADAGAPDTPQADDIQGMQYTYGTAAVGARPSADFTFGLGNATAPTVANFLDASTGSPTGWAWNFGDPASGNDNVSSDRSPSHVYRSPGVYTVTLIAGNLNGSGTVSKTVTVAAGPGICVADTNTLCLDNTRFSVKAFYRASDGRSGLATAMTLTPDSGYFWFFNPANIEVVVKVLDACAVSSHHWVFAAGLTNVEVTLTVTDTSSLQSKVYFNALGTPFPPIQDTSTFDVCP